MMVTIESIDVHMIDLTRKENLELRCTNKLTFYKHKKDHFIRIS